MLEPSAAEQPVAAPLPPAPAPLPAQAPAGAAGSLPDTSANGELYKASKAIYESCYDCGYVYGARRYYIDSRKLKHFEEVLTSYLAQGVSDIFLYAIVNEMIPMLEKVPLKKTTIETGTREQFQFSANYNSLALRIISFDDNNVSIEQKDRNRRYIALFVEPWPETTKILDLSDIPWETLLKIKFDINTFLT